MTAITNTDSIRTSESSLVTTLHLTYALHAVGLVIGALGASTVIGSFIFGWPSIIAVIINYVKRGDVRGTFLDSHFSWQIRTFWWALLWFVLWALVSIPLWISLIGIPVSWGLAIVLGVWVVYRIVRGWLALLSQKPLPM